MHRLAVTHSGIPWRGRAGGLNAPGLLLLVLVLANIAVAATWSGGLPDFFAFWSAAKFVRVANAGQLYDQALFHGFQLTLRLGSESAPFLYPPSALLLYWPLGCCRYPVAFALWVAIGLVAYVASLLPRERWLWGLTVLTILAAPATAACAVVGQIGLLLSALLIGGLRLAHSRPLLGGVLLGLATVKPQLTVLVPLALVAARLWRTLLWAMLTGAALVLLSAALFGAAAWSSWVSALPRIAQLLSALEPIIGRAMPTVAGNLRLIGAGAATVATVQLLAALAAATAVWHVFRRARSDAAIASLLTGSLLCTAYALWFDLTLLTGASILLVQGWIRSGEHPSQAAVVILVAALYLPLLMIGFAPVPLSALVVVLALALAASSAGRAPHRSELAPRAAPEPAATG